MQRYRLKIKNKYKFGLAIFLLAIVSVCVWDGVILWRLKNVRDQLTISRQNLIGLVKEDKWNEVTGLVEKTDLDLTIAKKDSDKLIVARFLPLVKNGRMLIGETLSYIDDTKDPLGKLTILLSKNSPYKDWTEQERLALWSDGLELFDRSLNHKEVMTSLVGSQRYKALVEAKPQIDKELPKMLGLSAPINYLVIFQNNTELRPTGGLWGAVADLKINKGLVEMGESRSIGDLNLYHPDISIIPEDIANIVKASGDKMGVEFVNSVSEFDKVAPKIVAPAQEWFGTKFDAVVAVDLDAVGLMLKLTGPIDVPNIGLVNADDYIDKLIYKPYSMAEASSSSRSQRKQGLGDAGKEAINKLLSSKPGSISKWGLESLSGRHVLLYSPQDELNSFFATLKAQGDFDRENSNFVRLEEVNFGGKQSLFIDRTMSVEKLDGLKYKATLTYSFEDNATARSLEYIAGKMLVRLRLPKGTKQISTSGGWQDGGNRLEILGTTALSNVLILKPGENKTLTFEYELPASLEPIVQISAQPEISFQPGMPEVKLTNN